MKAQWMVESAALLVDDVLLHQPIRQLSPWMACSRAMQEQLPRVLTFPFKRLLLLSSYSELMGKVLGIVQCHFDLDRRLVNSTRSLTHIGARQ